MRRVLPNILLLLQLIFLVPVYLFNPTAQVLGLGIALLAASVFLAYTNQPRGLEILLGLTAVLSFVGINFWGRLLTGSPSGGTCLVLLWVLSLVGIAALLWQRRVVVERGQIIVINQLPENRVLIWTEGLHRPLNVLVERRLAALPSYELDFELTIERVNTQSLFNVSEIKVLVRYRVAQPREVVVSFPNREQACELLAKERGEPDERDTDQQVAFWSELIRRQMALEIEQNVRSVVANVGGPADVAQDRESHARLIRKRLQDSVARWGMEVLDLRLLDVPIDPDRVRLMNRDKYIKREREDAQRLAEIRAEEVRLVGEAQAKAVAQMIGEMVRTLQQQGTSLTTEEIERVVITAMQRMSDQQQLSGFFRDVAQAGGPGAPATGPTTTLNPPSQPRR